MLGELQQELAEAQSRCSDLEGANEHHTKKFGHLEGSNRHLQESIVSLEQEAATAKVCFKGVLVSVAICHEGQGLYLFLIMFRINHPFTKKCKILMRY